LLLQNTQYALRKNMENKLERTSKLGLFVVIGLALFVITIYFVGKQKNMFGSTFHLKSNFRTVSGLKEGNNVRFSGINIGTVSSIQMISDTNIVVDLVLKKEVREFIKSDAKASISSDGLMGDKVLTISPGISKVSVKNNSIIGSSKAIEMEDVMVSMKKTIDNASIISEQLAQFSTKMNSGNGALSKIMTDEKFGKSLDATMTNLQKSTKGLDENMEAAKSNFLLKGYYKKKRRAAEKKIENAKRLEEKKIEEKK
jgi:phospholipid/cholesterol/gamma-HCH transport system substrate-binding protein